MSFSRNDKIFVKSRGFPPWPARVEGLAIETPCKIKYYYVYFYGTGETEVCIQDEMFPYIDNREKFGKLMEKKGFKECVSQVDSELGLSPSKHLVPIPNEQDSLVIEEKPGKKAKSGPTRATPTSTKENELKSKKRHSTDTETQPAKIPLKKSLASSDVDSQAVSQKSTPSEPPISRSGRKIKREKFSDGDEGESNEQDQETPKGRQGIEWEEKVLENGKTLKAQIESGEILPQNIKEEIQSRPTNQDMLVQLGHKMSTKDKLEFLKMEARLIQIDFQIKNSLSLEEADPNSCLKFLEEMSNLQLHPLMIKKNPEVLDTVQKLRNYIGNTWSWNMNEEETIFFSLKTSSIRSKAEHIMMKIKSLFIVPYGQFFRDVFAKELKTFEAAVEGMDIDDVISLTSDPTDKDIVKSEEDEQNLTAISAV